MSFRYIFMRHSAVRPSYIYLNMQSGRHELAGRVPPPHDYIEPMAPQLMSAGDGWRWVARPAVDNIITNGVQTFLVEDVDQHEMTISRWPIRVSVIIGVGPLFMQRVPVLKNNYPPWINLAASSHVII